MIDPSLLSTSSSLLLCLLPPLILFFFVKHKSISINFCSSKSDKFPRSYPLIGSLFVIYANRNRIDQWISDILRNSPSRTFVLHHPCGLRQVMTANPSNVEHILKTHFHLYEKGDFFRATVSDLFGDGLFTSDGDGWKHQRQIASQEFNTKSLRKFVENVVNTELSDRLLPILSAAAANKTVLDLQDTLQRFAFDNVCQIGFGYDPACLLPSFPEQKFAQAFDDAVRTISRRFRSGHPLVWKAKRLLNIGSEKELRNLINQVRGLAKEIVREKKRELKEESSLRSVDFLSRFLNSGYSDENFVTNNVISLVLGGRDTTSAALSWFFWLISRNQDVENEILREIGKKSEAAVYEEVKEMVYTHASLSETMRLYPPVPKNVKQAADDDVLPDGTFVKKGTRVTYHAYAMGRLEELWGPDWAEFQPERWLEEITNDVGGGGGKWRFVESDSFTYPVFQAGPRICLGKEMAFLQMKSVVAGVLRRFRVVPALDDGVEPEFESFFTTRMKGGFPVTIKERTVG